LAFDNKGYYDDHTVVNAINWHLLKDVEYRSVKEQISEDKLKNSINYDQKFLLGVLNSRLSSFYFFELFNIDLHFYPATLQSMPIPICKPKDQEKIVELVETILSTNANKEIGVTVNEIDQEVYGLYDLSPEEIKIVEETAS